MIAIGTSGYAYPDWKGRFYPAGLPQSQWLEYYSHHFSAVELNITFYRLPASPVFRHWRTRTPKEFRFVLKGSRLITHAHRLSNVHEPLAEFFERASELGDKLSCILWQLPPRFPHDVELLEEFLAETQRVQLVFGRVRQAIEFRDLSWFEEPIYEVLRKYNTAIAAADWPFHFPINDQLPLTADFVYCRRHGPGTRYSSPYLQTAIQQLARQIRPLAAERDVYVFFNNDTRAFAITNARQLQAALTGS